MSETGSPQVSPCESAATIATAPQPAFPVGGSSFDVVAGRCHLSDEHAPEAFDCLLCTWAAHPPVAQDRELCVAVVVVASCAERDAALWPSLM